MDETQRSSWELYLDLLRRERLEILRRRSRGKKKRTFETEEERMEDPVYARICAGNLEEDPQFADEFKQLKPLLEEAVQTDPAAERLTLHRLRNQSKILQRTQEILAVLPELDMDAFFQTHLDTLVGRDAEALEKHLLSNSLYFYPNLADGYNVICVKLSPANIDAFFGMFQGKMFRLFLENILLKRKLSKHLFDFFTKTYRELKDFLTVANDNPMLAQQYTAVMSKAETYADVYMQKMEDRFPLQHILSLMETRKAYRGQVNQYRRLLSIRRAVLQAIPKHYRDLYPIARSIHRSFILHIGPTNSGKTYDAITRLEESGNGVYLAPLRLLAYEQFDTMNHDGAPCNLLTGEEEISVVCANITASTIEMANLNRYYDVGVIDEAQMIADPERGGAWSAAILGLAAKEIHVCASPDAEKLLVDIIRSCGDDVQVVYHERQTPLIVQKENFHFPEDVREGDALIVFSKRDVHGVAAELQRRRKGLHTSIIYGALPYDVRHEEARRFREGETGVVVATDAIGMGLNLPIHRIVFLELTKFDGEVMRDLHDSEIKQIAGRAGRYGIYDEGYVASSEAADLIERAITHPDEPLKEAVIQFPETLLGINAPLTDILRKWMEVGEQEGWRQAKIERHLFLASLMENRYTDKEFLYRMITIPFDESNSELLNLWKDMYSSEEYGEHLDLTPYLPERIHPDTVTVQELDGLEHAYRICDLCANYIRLFLSDNEELRADIEDRKALLSKGIMRILATRKLKGKTCRRCGRTMSWDYPFSICQNCLMKERYS